MLLFGSVLMLMTGTEPTTQIRRIDSPVRPQPLLLCRGAYSIVSWGFLELSVIGTSASWYQNQ